METMAAIIAAMMGAKPQVTQMTAQQGGGGGGMNVKSMGGGGRVVRPDPPYRSSPRKTQGDIPEMQPVYEKSPQERGEPEVRVPYRPGMTPEDLEQAEEQASGWQPPDPDQLLQQWVEADSEVRRLSNPRSTADEWEMKKNLKYAEDRAAWAKKNIDEYNARQLAAKNQAAADDLYDAALPIIGKEQANAAAKHVLNYPDDANMVYGNIMEAAQSSRDNSAEIARARNKEDYDSAEMFNALSNMYPGVDTTLLSAMVQTDATMTENAAWLDGQRENVLEGNALETKDNMRRMDTYSSASRIVDQIGGIREHIANEGTVGSLGFVGGTVRKAMDILDPAKDGVPGRFSSWTDAGALDRLVDPIISKIGLQTINQMRQMSETGGALGNVSNFEVQMVQAALASLNTGQDKEQFLENLDIVETAFKRAAYLARNAPTMEAQAREAGVSSYEFMTRQLDELFPINEKFEQQMQFVPPPGMVARSPWASDGTAPQAVVPGTMINIPTDPEPASARTAEEYMAELARRKAEQEARQ